jgi:twinkle protein
MDAFCNYLDGKIFTYDILGSAKIDEVLQSSQVIFNEEEPDLFIFDNLMMLNSVADKLDAQQKIVQKLLNFAQTRNVHVILVAHPRKPESYLHTGSIRVTTPPNLYDVAGTSNMVNMVDNHVSVTRNDLKKIALSKQSNGMALDKKEEASLLEGDTIVIRDKNRDVGDNFIKFLSFCVKFQRLSDNHQFSYGRCNCKPYYDYKK